MKHSRAEFSGLLRALDFFELLTLLRNKQSTGRLELEVSTGIRFEISLSEGYILLAQKPEEPYFDLLLEQSGAERELVLDNLGLQSDWLMTLVALGYLSRKEAEKRLLEHCIDIGIEVARCDEGIFDFYAGRECELSEVRIDVNFFRLEIARRLDEVRPLPAPGD